MYGAIRGKRTIVGTVIGVALLGLSTGPALAHADAAPAPPTVAALSHPANVDGTVGQCMRMMSAMDCDMPGMMRAGGPVAPVAQR